MNVTTHIESALIRGGSPYSLAFVMQEFYAGALRLWIGSKMSASAWIRDDGLAEIVHVGGHWDGDDARWMLDGLEDWCREKGTSWTWTGRRGWVRFLKQRNVI